MRPRISTKNVSYLIKGTYGFTSIDQFFNFTEHHPSLRENVIRRVVYEFTGYTFKNGKLTIVNPYTNSYESLKIADFKHVTTKEELLKELSTLHKAKQAMLKKSREKLVELSKKKNRDKDLEAQVEKRTEREKQLRHHQTDREPSQKIEC